MNCLICHRQLTAAASIARHVGPECAAVYAARVSASGSTPERLAELVALDAPPVNRWLRLFDLAISAGRVRDARQFAAAAEREAAQAAPAPAAPAAPAPALPVPREIVIRRDERGRFVFCPPWKDQYFIADFKRRIGRPFRTWNASANQWEVTPLDAEMIPFIETILRRHFAGYHITTEAQS